MRTRWLLVATSALVPLAVAPSRAGEVTAGGGLEIEVSGFARVLATAGEFENTQLEEGLSSELDFSNDTEVHFTASATDDSTGLEYGGEVELEADTNSTANTDETWVFLQGGFGEVRFGDQDGVADSDGMAVSAVSLSAGNDDGGLDGTQVGNYVTKVLEPIGTSDATKILYNTPSLGGATFGVSFTPQLAGLDSGDDNGDTLASTSVEAQNVLEAAVVYEGELGGIETQLGVSGLVGDLKDVDEEEFGGGDNYWSAQVGAVVGLSSFKLAGSYLTEEVGSFEQQGVTAGASYEIGPLLVSVNYGLTLDAENADFDQPYNLVFSFTYGLAPGLTLNGDFQYVDNDTEGDLADEFADDNGFAGIAGLELAF